MHHRVTVVVGVCLYHAILINYGYDFSKLYELGNKYYNFQMKE